MSHLIKKGHWPSHELGWFHHEGDWLRVVAIPTPWGVFVRAGCLRFSLDVWEKHWEDIAATHGVRITAKQVKDWAQASKALNDE